MDDRLRLPWTRVTRGHANVFQIADSVARSLAVPLPDGIPPNTDATWIENADGKIVAFIGNGPRQTENGDLIVEAVAALAALDPAPAPVAPERLRRAAWAALDDTPKERWMGGHDWLAEASGYYERGEAADYPRVGQPEAAVEALRTGLAALAAPVAQDSPDPEVRAPWLYSGQHDDCIATIAHYHAEPYQRGQWGAQDSPDPLPVGAYVASALMAASIPCDSGEDVDRFLDELRKRGYVVVRAAIEGVSRDPATGPNVTWPAADNATRGRRTVLVELAPIGEDGLCTGCGKKPTRETGSCRCLFRVDEAIR